MPKGRYAIMRRYMPKVGTKGLDMMFRTCTVQANLDFANEADMVAKFRVSLALQPIATALFANSPFVEGRPSGLLSARAAVWSDTDAARTGLLPFVFEPGFGFEAYARHALGVPMYFVKRDGRYIDVAGRSFADFMEGRLPGLEGERPTIKDWADHLSTLFPGGAAQAVPGDAGRRRRRRSAGCAPSRRCGPASSTIRPPRPPPGTCAAIGRRRTGRVFAATFRARLSARRSRGARCATSPATWSPSPGRV